MPDAVVEVAVPRPLRRLFDYLAPAPIAPGARVRVPFGGSSVVGIVVGNRPDSPHALKATLEQLDDEPLLPTDLIELATWLAHYYHHPIGDVYAALLPVLARRGAVARKSEQAVWQPLAKDGAAAALARAPRQRIAYDCLLGAGSLAEADCRALGIESRHLNALAQKGLARRLLERKTPDYRLPARDSPHLQPTTAQESAIEAITASFGSGRTLLLDGVTGSGKTEVYLRVIEDVLAAGRQALVLVPEIALTPQTAAHFRQRFGAAAVLHSAATDQQRFDTWLKCRDGLHRVLIGTRSAVLTPFQDLGVIIVDEEHDDAFKQFDGLRYSARDVAVKRGRMLSVPVVLGTATPSLESLANARRGRYGYARLAERAGGASLPRFRVLDLRGMRTECGFSDPLHDAIERHLAAGGQVLVFLNRRGYAPVLLCSACAWQAECDRCDVRLTHHRDGPELRCHQCDRRRSVPRRCPQCDSESLLLLGAGTQRLEEALAERHPGVPIYRIDRDTTRSVKRLALDLETLAQGAPAILVGTQMLAKGHHLPGVTLVAVLYADNGFLSPDFRAPERTVQLIVQVAGRAGRAERPGEVWIQTYSPRNTHLAALISSNYQGFAEHELRARRAAGMPPFASLAVVRADSRRQAAPDQLLAEAARVVAAEDVEVLGPAPASIARRSGRYHSQLLVLSRRRRSLHRALSRLEQAALRAPGVHMAIDVDPRDTA